MKRKTREERAITLIALIITIVVLLILAVVAINAVTGDGIIQHAVNAKTEYEKAQDEEESMLSYYEGYLDNKGNVGPWRQEGDYIVLKDESIRLAIGDKVNYEPTELSYTSSGDATGIGTDQIFNSSDYTSGWQVLGIENGNLLLISSNVIKSTDNKNYSIFKGKELYLNGTTELNNICSIFGKGNGAKNARSVKVEDINKITGYDPEKIGNGVSGFGAYGNKIGYSFRNGILSYTCTLAESGTINGETNLYYLGDNDWKTTIEDGQTKSFIIDNYVYYATRETSPVEGKSYIEMNMSTETEKCKLLFNENIGDYWLASPTISNYEGMFNMFVYGIRHVKPSGKITGLLVGAQITIQEPAQRGVRAVVTLKEDVNLEYDKTNNIWKIVNE